MRGDEPRPGEVTIVARTEFSEVGDRVEVEWTLSTTPGPDWAGIFQMAVVSDRQGPLDWVEGGGPDVIGAVVRWFVPVDAVDNADVEVRHRLSVANQRCR